VVIPTIAGRAWTIAQGMLLHDPMDPLRSGAWNES
jgi:proline racemase